MTYEEIQKALEEGKTIHWKNHGYILVDSSSSNTDSNFYIVWNQNGMDENCVGVNESQFNYLYAHTDFFLGE